MIFDPSERIKRLLAWFWAALIVSILIYIAFHPDLLSVESMQNRLRTQQFNLWAFYILLLIVRGFIMLPITPFLFLGIALFPEAKWLVVLLTMMSIFISAAFFYYFSAKMGGHQFFERKYPKRMAIIERRLQQPQAMWIVAFWSFFPFTPTDVICYVAGMVQMRFRFLVLGVLIGQLPLNIIYAYFGGFVF